MKVFKFLLAALVVLCFAPALVQAEMIRIGFNGIVDNVTDDYTLLENNVRQGDAFTGLYTYDSSTPNSTTNPEDSGWYHYTTAPYGISVTVGGFTFQTDFTHVDFGIGLSNDSQGNDGFGFMSKNNLMQVNGETVTSIILEESYWQLTDNLGLAISSIDLPTTPPELSKWPFNNLHIEGRANDGTGPCSNNRFWFEGPVTEVYIIPEPASACLIVLGGLLLRGGWHGQAKNARGSCGSFILNSVLHKSAYPVQSAVKNLFLASLLNREICGCNIHIAPGAQVF